ncbi:MAG: FHA domain-containing protein, partial [Anaerolineae bacterium]|nr:FHA domain-containing protein [Anaerolineae bacterium]
MSRAESERPILIIQTENQPAYPWPMMQDSVVAGRDEHCDLPLDDRQVSRHHIRFYR